MIGSDIKMAAGVRLIVGSHCASGDELGRVTVKDFLGTKPVQAENVHSRRVTGLAFSTHR